MKPMTHVLWPWKLRDYVRGVSPSSFPYADKTPSTAAPSYVTVGPDDSRWCSPMKAITTYWDLVQQVARLISFNTRYQFYFRGHDRLTRLPNGMGNTVTPLIWRSGDEDATEAERERAFCDLKDELRDKSERLRQAYRRHPDSSSHIINLMDEGPLVQWALLEHYECCPTPLLNVTRSLHVASSFALMPRDGSRSDADVTGYIVVLGLPHQREAITTNQRQGILNLELLGITPHNAMRPLMQDAYLACSFDWWRTFCDDPYSFGQGDAIDFSGRIAAIFEVKNEWKAETAEAKAEKRLSYYGEFWEMGMGAPVDMAALFPAEDRFFDFLESSGLEPKSYA